MHRKYTFLFKENNTYDRDCVKYVELKEMKNNKRFYLHGACFSGYTKDEIPSYENVTTILSKEEYEILFNHNKDFDYTEIINKLESEQNEILFKEVQEEEKEYLMEEYGFSEDDIEYIFDEYYLDYRDRAIVGCTYNDVYDFGYDEAWQLGYVNMNDSIMERYFDFEKFGEDLLNEERYIELENGKIVCLNY